MQVRALSEQLVCASPFRPLPCWVRARINSFLSIAQAGRDSRKQQGAKEDYQIGLVNAAHVVPGDLDPAVGALDVGDAEFVEGIEKGSRPRFTRERIQAPFHPGPVSPRKDRERVQAPFHPRRDRERVQAPFHLYRPRFTGPVSPGPVSPTGRYSGLTATLRNLITPAPCCSANGPSANRPLWSSAVCCPLRTTTTCRPLAVIS